MVVTRSRPERGEPDSSPNHERRPRGSRQVVNTACGCLSRPTRGQPPEQSQATPRRISQPAAHSAGRSDGLADKCRRPAGVGSDSGCCPGGGEHTQSGRRLHYCGWEVAGMFRYGWLLLAADGQPVSWVANPSVNQLAAAFKCPCDVDDFLTGRVGAAGFVDSRSPGAVAFGCLCRQGVGRRSWQRLVPRRVPVRDRVVAVGGGKARWAVWAPSCDPTGGGGGELDIQGQTRRSAIGRHEKNPRKR